MEIQNKNRTFSKEFYQTECTIPVAFRQKSAQAIQLKKEVPTRSVSRIILILEMEGWVAPGILRRSTLQRYLYKAGFGIKQMKCYTEARNATSRRFCKPHRMMPAHCDIMYGLKLPVGEGGKKVQTYLSVITDVDTPADFVKLMRGSLRAEPPAVSARS